MFLADDVYCCLFVTIVMLRNLNKGLFSVDLENTSIETYHLKISSLVVISGFLKQ